MFRQFPLNIEALATSTLARRIAGDDAGKYFEAIDLLFKAQDRLMEHTKDTLNLIGKQQVGMSDKAVETCIENQAVLDRLKADQNIAFDTLNVAATPNFFINCEKLKGAMSFEDLDQKIRSVLKRRPLRFPWAAAAVAALQ